MADRYGLADVESLLAVELPEFMRWVEGDGEEEELPWRDEEGTLHHVLLGYLQSWLLALRGRRHREEVREAFEVVERLAQSNDPELEGALIVGLLEGHWPRGHLRLMGPRTRELWEPACLSSASEAASRRRSHHRRPSDPVLLGARGCASCATRATTCGPSA